MANIYNFSEPEILAFILVFIRMASFVVSWPVFGVRTVPSTAKVLFALICSMIIFPTIYTGIYIVPLDSLEIVFLVMKEVFVGLSLGFLARMFFFSVSVAGQVSSVSMGISSSQLFNPALGAQSSSLEQLKVSLATLFFLGINGHHIFLGGLVQSFELVPLSMEGINLTILGSTGEVVHTVMAIGIRLAAPVLVAILFLNIAMAVIGRAVPQINVLVTSLPVNILIGFGVLFISLPLLVWQMSDLLNESAETVFKFLKAY